MGKRRKLNRLISRWIRSDLPEDRSTVLLLGVTRIPTSPTPARRPCSLPLASPPTDSRPPLVNGRRRSSSSSRKRNAASRSSTLKHIKPETSTPTFIITACQENNAVTCSPAGNVIKPSNPVTSPNTDSNGDSPGTVMDRSVDSIGTCSLDVEASVESSDWSEASSIGTLRSASIPATPPEPTKLPSYLSLACTVNGYSTTTNYDPERLARSRDTSPHRPNEHHAPQNNLTTYTIYNNLLSPPNLVPLPIYNSVLGLKKDTICNMSENTMATTTHHRREFYSSSAKSTVTTYNSESKNITTITYSSDSVDSCLENGLRDSVNKCVKYEANALTTNGTDKSVQDYSSVQEKSVIQQRVERLYGPGYLAQGFLLTKRQKNKSYETENLGKNLQNCQDQHSKSMNDQLLQDEPSEGGMKQSTSSPTLPVFRHLRPEFRAQLPVARMKKATDNSMQKSVTIPTLVDGVKVNGHTNVDKESCDSKTVVINGNASINGKTLVNGTQNVDCDKIKHDNNSKEIVTKDGHYFLIILEKETQRLLSLANEAEKELEQPDLPEEATGYLRSTSGKAKLLVSQKMQQFKGLCTNNIKQVEGEAFPTTNEDLQGFWDMIMLQIDQVDTLFKELDTLRANDWQEQKPPISTNGSLCKPRKVIKTTRPVSASAEENRKLREVQRKKMLEEKRKAMREQQKKPTSQSIEIFVPETS